MGAGGGEPGSAGAGELREWGRLRERGSWGARELGGAGAGELRSGGAGSRGWMRRRIAVKEAQEGVRAARLAGRVPYAILPARCRPVGIQEQALGGNQGQPWN